MADLDKIQERLNSLKADIRIIGTELNDTNKYAEGFVKNMADLATTASKKGALWSIIGRASAGSKTFYALQNQLRSIVFVFKYMETAEKDRVKKAEAYNEQLNKQIDRFKDLSKKYTGIKKLNDDISNDTEGQLTKLTEYNLLLDEGSRLRIKQIGFDEYLNELNDKNINQMKGRLKIERNILNQLGEGYKLSEKYQKVMDKSFNTGKVFGGGGLMQQLFDPEFFETKELAEQFLSLKEEINIFTDFFNEQNNNLEAEEERKRNLQQALELLEIDELSQKRKKQQLQEELDNIPTASPIANMEEFEELAAKRRGLEEEYADLDAQIKIMNEDQRRPSKMFERYKEDGLLIEAEKQKLIARANEIATLDEQLFAQQTAIEERHLQIEEENTQLKNEANAKLRAINESEEATNKERERIHKELAELEKSDLKQKKEAAENELAFKQKNLEILEEDLSERGVTYDEGKDALARPATPMQKLGERVKDFRQLDRKKQTEVILKKLGLPLTGLYKTVKMAFLSYMTKKNFNKIFSFAGKGIVVFAQIIYAVTLLGLLVYILHKSGFIEGVKNFLQNENVKKIFSAYFDLILTTLGGLWDFITGIFDLLYALFSGGSFKDDVMPALKQILVGLGTFLIGGLGTIILGAVGIVLGGIATAVMGVVGVFQKAFGSAKEKVEGAAKYIPAMGVTSGAAFGAKLGMGAGLPGILAGAAIGGIVGGAVGFMAKEATMATGGIAGKGGLFLVGENGPELVNLPTGSKVFNNSQSRNMMGGNTINVNVNGRVGATDQELDDLARKIGRKINLEMNRYNNSGFRV